MLTKQKAVILTKCLKAGKAEAQVVYNYLNRNAKISASKMPILNKKVKEIRAVADKSLKVLAQSFANPKEVRIASKYPIVEDLLAQASSLQASATILAHLVAEGDELADLPDEVESEEVTDADGNEISADDLPEDEAIDSEDEIENETDEDGAVVSDDEITDDLESDDEITDDLEADDELSDDALDSCGDSDLESDDELGDEPVEPVQSKLKKPATKFVKANKKAVSVKAKSKTIGVKAANQILSKNFPWNFGKSGK